MFDDFFTITLMTLEDGSLAHAPQCCCMACWEDEHSDQQEQQQQQEEEEEDCDLGCQCPVCHERILEQIEENLTRIRRHEERLRTGF